MQPTPPAVMLWHSINFISQEGLLAFSAQDDWACPAPMLHQQIILIVWLVTLYLSMKANF